MTDRQAEALIWYQAGLKQSEIARALGITREGARQLVRRAEMVSRIQKHWREKYERNHAHRLGGNKSSLDSNLTRPLYS